MYYYTVRTPLTPIGYPAGNEKCTRVGHRWLDDPACKSVIYYSRSIRFSAVSWIQE